MTHELKTWPEYFEDVWYGRKEFELRKNDRNYQMGDVLRLQEWDNDAQEYTGREIKARVRYVLHGGIFGLAEGFCIMGLYNIQSV